MYKVCILVLLLTAGFGGQIMGENIEIPHETTEGHEIALFGAGCFWKVENTFMKVPGVTETMVGFSGGDVVNPSYRDVTTGTTGHAETVRVVYDPETVSYEELLHVFWTVHNPTQLNRQGPDVGRQYRSVIFFTTDAQHEEALKAKKEAQKDHSRSIVTEIVPATPFYRAEEYHQKYLEKGRQQRG